MKVGDYVRTKRGTFDRFITSHTQDNLTWYTFEDRGNITNPENYIIKSSPNIIDLIEENDYIRIITDTDFRRVYNSYGKLVIYREGEIEEIPIENFSNKFIGGVITSEQIESMEYKVKE